MNRRQALALAGCSPVVGKSQAGVMDWFNGVTLNAPLPEFDADYIGASPPDERKLLLIDFWATWCAPCRAEFPHLNQLNSQFAQDGLVVVGLTQETKAVAEAFLPKVSIKYFVGAGGDPPLQKQLGIKALPYAVLVSREGKIVWRGQARGLSAAAVAQWLKSVA